MPDPKEALHKYLLNEQTHGEVRSCGAGGAPAEMGTPQPAKEGRSALPVPTQAALAARREESSSPEGASSEFFSCSELEGSPHDITPGYISKINEQRLVSFNILHLGSLL